MVHMLWANFIALLTASKESALGEAAVDFTKRWDQSYLELGRVTHPNLGWVQCVLRIWIRS